MKKIGTWDVSLGLRKVTDEQAAKIIDNRTPDEIEKGLCSCCGEYKTTVKCRRQNTAYVDDICNFVVMCVECFKENEAYWNERWDELYSELHAGIRAGNLAERM